MTNKEFEKKVMEEKGVKTLFQTTKEDIVKVCGIEIVNELEKIDFEIDEEYVDYYGVIKTKELTLNNWRVIHYIQDGSDYAEPENYYTAYYVGFEK